jgi:predicted ribosome quality control (RQC) complex YloA/Tae2 family protein
MPLDASAVRAAVFEINEKISSGRIEKIYQPERDEIIIAIRTFDGAKKLVVSANSANPRMYLTSGTKENPSEPPMFCMLLRKHLTGGKIVGVTQRSFERIADVEIEARNEMGDTLRKHIVCEIMGKNSNIMLLDDNEKIIDSIKHVDITVSRVRNIFPGLTYRMPPDSDRLNPLEMNEDDFYDVLCGEGEGRTIDKALTARIGGISPLLAREASFRAIGDSCPKIGEMSEADKRKTAHSLAKMFEDVKEGRYSPCVIYKNGDEKPMDFSAVEIGQYSTGFTLVKKDSICAAMEDYYSERDAAERMRSRSYALMKTVNSHLERVRKKKLLLSETIRDAAEREKYKIAGDMITANLYRMKTGDKSLTAVNYYDPEQREITIKLDEAKSPSKNAQQYYKKYTKAKTAEIEAEKQLQKANEEEEYLTSVIHETQTAKTPSELEEIRRELTDAGIIKSTDKRKKKEKKPSVSAPTAYFFEGYTIYSGKNNVQNDYLTMKMGRANDLWLHTKNIPGSHVLVKYMGEEFPDSVIEAAACIAATNSKGASSPKVDVDYCPVSHVRKPNGAKAGMVVYEGYNTASVVPDETFCRKLLEEHSKKA